MARRRRHEEHANHERWLVSGYDLMTMLFIVMTVLYAMSSPDAEKYKALANSMAEAFGNGPSAQAQFTPGKDNGGTDPEGPPVVEEEGEDEDENPNEAIKARISAAIVKNGLKDKVEVSTDERGVVIYFTDEMLFAEAKADVLPQGQKALKDLVPSLNAQPFPVVVEGHTDSRPISTFRFPSNWELSTSRATQVLRTLTSFGVPTNQLSASGYADTHPRADNKTGEGRASNRRVEIVVVTGNGFTNPAATTSAVK